MTEYVPPQLITVLKTYQDNAPKGLHGPGLSLVHPSKSGGAGPPRPETPESHHVGSGAGLVTTENGLIVQPITGPLPMPSHPIMTTPDPDCGVVQLTTLEGKKIGCFLLGGEMRLCLPQIFNNILMEFSVEQINRSIQELMIYLYNCTDQQLQEFKRANIIPDTAKTCGLITRTNAERLCSYMLHQADQIRPRKGTTLTSFRVYHKCFGKCEGIFTVELYSYKEPACIECCECQGMFSPQKFVCHQHDRQENRTCHWGFNSSNWCAYIHVALDEDNREAFAKILEEIWSGERETETEQEYWIAKQKVIDDESALVTIKTEPLSDIPLKKPKLINEPSLYQCSRQAPSSAFRPWTQKRRQEYAQQQLLLQHMVYQSNGLMNGVVGGLSQEPPVLQNPESVVRLSESDKFERSFQPNVALVPRKTILCKERERNERERLPADPKDRSVIKCDVQIKQESPPTPPATGDVIRSVIKCDVKIKEERPSTPPQEMSPGPRLAPCSSPSPPLPPLGTPAAMLGGGGGTIKSVPMPYSPVTDVHSGSNEITSSTSPVPPPVNMTTTTTMNGCIADKPKLIIKEQISPPSPRRTPLLNEEMHHQHQRSHPQAAVILKNGGGPIGAPGAPIAGNPEFELSTDTDDDSLAGEPDSSNNSMAPLEIIAELMKDVAHETRDQILHILKLVIQETTQLRNEHLRLLKDHAHREDMIADLQRDKEHLEQQVHQLQLELNRSLIKYATSEANALQMQQQHQQDLAVAVAAAAAASASSSTPPSPLSLASNSSSSQITIEKIERRNSFPEKSEVIMKPLKKSLRRSPDDSVLMLQSPPPPLPPPPVMSLPVSLSITAASNLKLPVDPLQTSHEHDDKPPPPTHHPIAASPTTNGGAANGVITSPRPPSRPPSSASTASNTSAPVLENGLTGKSQPSSKEPAAKSSGN
ncbi:ski oncogene [Culex quinquefasciatus]|uniref:ski oncogene n=1 Tax=Culex quinquefasciatus TaxID=7176 RepID=UPI0018E2C5D9|nr:ski oncogene [Culex quinquefasciatus]